MKYILVPAVIAGTRMFKLNYIDKARLLFPWFENIV